MSRSRSRFREATHKAGRELAQLNQALDSRFDILSERLITVAQKATAIVSDSHSAAGLLSGAQFQQSIEALHAIPQAVESLPLGHSGARQSLDEMLLRLERCRRLVSGFPQVILGLKVLAFQMRAEGARLRDGEVEFGSVVDAVNSLALDIEVRSRNILETSEALVVSIRQTLGRLLEVNRKEEHEIAGLLTQSKESIDLFTRAGTAAALSAQQVARSYDEVSSHIHDLVQSMQFQDITRQQVEHILAGISDVAQLVEDGHRRWWWFPDSSKLAEAGYLGNVQVAQIRNSRQILTDAVETIEQRLQAIAGSLRRIGSRQSATSREEGQAGQIDLLEKTGAHLNRILDLLRQYSTNERELATVLQGVSDSIGRTVGLADQIEEIGFRLGLASLNAQVKAAHLGQEGAALGTLAARAQEITSESTAKTAEVATLLRALSEDMKRLASGSDALSTAPDAAGAIPALAAQIHQLLETLSSYGMDFRRQMGETAESCGVIERELLAVIGHFSEAREAEQTLSQVAAELEAPLADLQSRYRRHGKAPIERIAAHAGRYTMSSEREVQAALAGQPAPAAASAPATAPSQPHDLGENVELF